ncbi:MAG TPA: LptA/OstA family protein [Candidatus Binatia bacterium]|nr:LptA/OstA family protein [Candidatus Binatia bacterium]
MALLLAVPVAAENVVKNTDEALSSMAGVARNLKLADVPSPIDVTADKLEFDYNKGLLLYTGNVEVKHAGVVIKARDITVAFEPEGERGLKKITARGGVEVLREEETARGELAEYDPAAGTIVLSQNARLGSGNNVLSGERVVVYLREGRAVVQGGAGAPATGKTAETGAAPPGRVRVVIMPDGGASKATDKPAPAEKKP